MSLVRTHSSLDVLATLTPMRPPPPVDMHSRRCQAARAVLDALRRVLGTAFASQALDPDDAGVGTHWLHFLVNNLFVDDAVLSASRPALYPIAVWFRKPRTMADDLHAAVDWLVVLHLVYHLRIHLPSLQPLGDPKRLLHIVAFVLIQHGVRCVGPFDCSTLRAAFDERWNAAVTNAKGLPITERMGREREYIAWALEVGATIFGFDAERACIDTLIIQPLF